MEGPDEACTGTLTNPALAVLCPLWQGDTLPERQQAMLGMLIVRIANQGLTPPRHDDDDDDEDEEHDKGRHRGDLTRAQKLIEDCRKFVEKHPEQENPHAAFCREVLERAANATPTATATATTTPLTAGTVDQRKQERRERIEQQEQQRKIEFEQRGRSSHSGGKR